MEKKSKPKSNKARSFRRREINPLQLLKAIWKNLWLIILAAVICGAGVFVGTKLFVKPTYRADFTAYVNNKVDVDLSTLTSSDVAASQALATSYAQVITSRTVLTEAASSLGLKYSYSKLKSMVSTEVSKKSEIITVYVVSNDPDESFRLADAVERCSLKATSQIIEGSSMTIIDKPVYTNRIYRPNYKKRALFGALIGFFAAVLFICIRQLTNDVIRDENEFAQRYSIPIIGVIPDMMNVDKNKGGYYYYYYYGHASEQPEEGTADKNTGEGGQLS